MHAFSTTKALLTGVAGGVFLLASHPAMAKSKTIEPDELLSLSLEQLTNVEVTSVSKKREKVSEAAAAIFVISNDDIVRSGATSIPEALRMVPGLSVAQSGSRSWAISSRGFTGQFANKLLVLIDGRSVYTPLFSGVWWDVQDTPLQDIERIEVIRGPGATLWGANAVNGVINIITKNAKDTQGNMLSQTVGNVQRSLTTVRHGGKIDDKTHARVYAKYDEHDEFRNSRGAGANDEWNKSQGGFRIDNDSGDGNSWTFQGDAYRSGQSYPMNIPVLNAALTSLNQEREKATGGNMLARINQRLSADEGWMFQMYFDNVQRSNDLFEDHRTTLDAEFQHNWNVAERHSLVWGAGYRLISDNTTGTARFNLNPDNRTSGLFNAFAQDEITLIPNELKLTLGTKVEFNDFTSPQIQPSARLTWLVDEKQTVWASAAHAVRTPNRFSDDGTLVLATQNIGGGNFAYVQTMGSHRFDSEKLNAYELGYRVQPMNTLSFDLATFYNDYNSLVTNSVGGVTSSVFMGGASYFVIPVKPVNGNQARAYGVELAAHWDPASYWKLDGSYTFLDFQRKKADQLGFTLANASPPQQFNVRSTLLLPHDVELNNSFYYVDSLRNQRVPDYVRADVRLAWKPIEGIEVSLVGQNLLDPAHQEFGPFVYQNRADVPRSFYGNVTWKF